MTNTSLLETYCVYFIMYVRTVFDVLTFLSSIHFGHLSTLNVVYAMTSASTSLSHCRYLLEVERSAGTRKFIGTLKYYSGTSISNPINLQMFALDLCPTLYILFSRIEAFHNRLDNGMYLLDCHVTNIEVGMEMYNTTDNSQNLQVNHTIVFFVEI